MIRIILEQSSRTFIIAPSYYILEEKETSKRNR